MKMNRHKKVKTIGALVLAMVLAIGVGGYIPQETLAAGGNVTVSLANAKGLDAETEFTFEMYKVGEFNGAAVELEPELQDADGVDLDFAAGKTESEGAKSERMLKSAKALTRFINDNDIELDAVGTYKLKAGESFTEAVEGNGLYLVRSHTVRDAAEGAKFDWTPQPVYVSAVAGDASVELDNVILDDTAVIKIVKTPISLNHMVVKSWVITDGAGDVKPDSITVNIRYGGDIIDTVELTAEDDWSYTWESEESGDKYKYIGSDDTIEFTPDKSDPNWSCDEEPVENFSVEYADPVLINPEDDLDDQLVMHEITNTYEPPETPPVPPSKKVKTGDDNRLIGWIAGLAVALILLVIIYLRRRKSREDI